MRARYRPGPSHAECHSFIGSRDWTNSLALDQLSLIVGAHILRSYTGLPTLGFTKRGGLAPWQGRRAAELIRESLDGNIRLSDMACECGLSVSHFTRAFRKSFGKSPYRTAGDQQPSDRRYRHTIRLFRSDCIHSCVRAPDPPAACSILSSAQPHFRWQKSALPVHHGAQLHRRRRSLRRNRLPAARPHAQSAD
jgi:Bacterial regulatory helix-turn-helix proteins, AraC family